MHERGGMDGPILPLWLGHEGVEAGCGLSVSFVLLIGEFPMACLCREPRFPECGSVEQVIGEIFDALRPASATAPVRLTHATN